MRILPPVSIEARRLLPSRWDVLAALLVLGFIALFADASRTLVEPLSSLTRQPLSLDPVNLPGYALRTSMRMLIALAVSLIFTLTYATWAAKSQRAGSLLVPLLDILQSVPILGFISITVVFFLSLAPGRIFGAELAAVFAIFTSQAWNMAFSFYQSLRTVPEELVEAGRMFGMNGWARFWRIEVPFGLPPLIWNMMMSMSGGWFFVTLSEAISVGHTTIALPGIGSYIAQAIVEKNLHAIFWAIGTMLVVILIYDQLLFRPLVAWADRFRFDTEESEDQPESWLLDVLRRSSLMDRFAEPFHVFMRWTYRLSVPMRSRVVSAAQAVPARAADIVWGVFLSLLGAYAVWRIYALLAGALGWDDVFGALGLGAITMIRVTLLIALASVVWTPIGVYVGMRPHLARVIQPVAQFLAAFPGEPSVSARRLRHRPAEAQSGHRAVAADGAGYAVVHPVQRHRRRIGDPARAARCGEQPAAQGLAMVAQGRAARCLSLLRHRRDHGFGRIVERQHRRRGGKLGQPDAARPRTWRLYRRRDHGRRFSSHRSWHRHDEFLRRGGKPVVLAPALLVRGTALPADMR